MISIASDNFLQWASSFSGCDGGSEDADTWLCGIEWGYAKNRRKTQEEYEQELSNFYDKMLPAEISEGEYMHKESYDWVEHNKYPYGISVAKLYSAINGVRVEDYLKYISTLNGSELFKFEWKRVNGIDFKQCLIRQNNPAINNKWEMT